MAHMTFAHDLKPSMDAPLEAIAEAATVLNKPIKVRVQPDLYDWGAVRYGTWLGLAWTMECQDVEEGRRLREGLTMFFRLFGGEAKVQERLLRELGKMAAVGK